MPMNKYLSADEYKVIQTHLAAGDACLTISRSISRQFFMRVSNASIMSNTGNSALPQKILVWACQACALLSLVICCGLIIDSFGWWAALAVPVCGASWAILAGFTNVNGGWRGITASLVGAIVSYSFLTEAYSLPLILFVFSLWAHRMTYILAQILLIAIVKKSYAAYDMLIENVEITDPMTPEPRK